MPLPQVIVRRGDRGAAPIPADDVSTRFELVISDRGPIDRAVECRSIGQVRQTFGDHSTTSSLRAVESYFAEGGTRAVLTRVVGRAPAWASLNLTNASGGVVVSVRANEPGTWFHRIKIDVAGDRDPRTVIVLLDEQELIAGECSSADEVVELLNATGYVTAASGAGAWPIRSTTTGALPLAGGDDDLDDIGYEQFRAALDTFEADLGAGSVCASAWATRLVHELLADHAAATNRFARGDLYGTTPSSLVAHGNWARDLPNARHLQLLVGSPLVSIGGALISVPPSGVHTGREARADRENAAGPGQPCAWTFGEYATPVGIDGRWSKIDREAINDAGITVLVQDPQGAIYAEDAITLALPSRYPQYAEVAAMRVTMAIHAQAQQALRSRVMQTIDGNGHLVAAATADLAAICNSWYSRGALYGADASEAFQVSVEAETTSAGRARLVGYLALRPSPSAHTVELTITQVAASDTI